MTVFKKKVTAFRCDRCDHEWIPRQEPKPGDELPRVCPKCKSPYWNRARRDGSKGKQGR